MTEKTNRFFRLIIAAFILSAASYVSAAHASGGDLASYRLNISTHPGLIDNIDNMDWRKHSCWILENEYWWYRATPTFRLTNTSPAGGPSISEFSLDLTGRGAVFDTFGAESFPGGVAPLHFPALGDLGDGKTSNKLIVSFANRPLRPGESAVFRLGLKSTRGVSNRDFNYSEVFWDETGNNRSDNAVVTTIFDFGKHTLSSRFFEFPRANKIFNEDSYFTKGKSVFVSCAGMKKNVDYMMWYEYKHRKLPPTPTPTPTNTPTHTPTNTPTHTPTHTPTNTPTKTPTSTPTNTPKVPGKKPTKTPTPTPTATPTKKHGLASIVPSVDCKKINPDGTFTFFLGYENFNNFAVSLPRGTDNPLFKNILTVDGVSTPLQPELFNPGSFNDQVRVSMDPGSIVRWVIQYSGHLAEAESSTNTPECTLREDCVENLVRDRQFAVDVETLAMSKLVAKLSRAMVKTGAASKAKAKTVKKDAKAIYMESWTAVWSMPEILLLCPGTSLCARTDNTAVITMLNSNSSALLKLAKKAAKDIKRRVGNRPAEKRILQKMKSIHRRNLQLISTIPSVASVCS